MALKKYLLGIGIATVLSLCSFLLILFFVDPKDANVLIWVLFFATFSLSVLGLYMLLGYLFRVISSNNANVYTSVGPLLRQGILLAIFLNGLLVLGKLQVLTWWDALMMFTLLGLIELYFHTRE